MKIILTKSAVILLMLLTACQSRHPYFADDSAGFLDQPYRGDQDLEYVHLKIDHSTTLSDLKKFAALNNASLKSAYLKWQAEIFRIYPAGQLPDPQISYTYYIQEVETRVGPQQHALSLMQKLPWFGKLDLKQAMQTSTAKAAKAEYDSIRNQLFSKIGQLYYDYWYLQQSRRITGENLKLLESLEPLVRNKIKVGDGSRDLIKLQIEIAKLTDVNENLKLRKIPLDARLNQLLNRPANSAVKLTAVLGRVTEEWNEKDLLAAIQNNPALHKFDFIKKAVQTKAELADLNRYPDFTAGIKWIQTDSSRMNTDDNGKDPVMATVGFSIPWDQRKYDHLVSAARNDYRAVNWSQKEYQNSLEARLKTALFEIEDNLRVIKLYSDTLVPKTEESLSIAIQAYRNAQESFIGFVDLQRQLLNFQLVLEKARKNIAVQKTLIEEITGTEFKPAGGENE